MNRRGVIADWPVILIIIFILIIGFIFMSQIFSGVFAGFLANPDLSSNSDSTSFLNRAESVLNGFDKLIFFFYIMMGLGLVLAAFLIDTHPIFFYLALIILAAMVIVGALLSNIGMNIIDGLETGSANFPLTTHLLTKYPLFIMVFLFISAIVFYAKSQSRR